MDISEWKIGIQIPVFFPMTKQVKEIFSYQEI